MFLLHDGWFENMYVMNTLLLVRRDGSEQIQEMKYIIYSRKNTSKEEMMEGNKNKCGHVSCRVHQRLGIIIRREGKKSVNAYIIMMITVNKY